MMKRELANAAKFNDFSPDEIVEAVFGDRWERVRYIGPSPTRADHHKVKRIERGRIGMSFWRTTDQIRKTGTATTSSAR